MNETKKLAVTNKIKDWKKRINTLYAFVEKVLDNKKEITLKKTGHVELYEKKMHKYGVKPVNLPTLEIFKNKKMIVIIEPRGLWVLGADGMIDILTEHGAYIIAGIQEKNKKAKWEVFALKKNFVPRKLDSKLIMEVIS